MVGFMNEEAFQKTVETGYAVFYSRSRNKLWLKGESSGHRLVVVKENFDGFCDPGCRAAEGGGARAGRVPRRI